MFPRTTRTRRCAAFGLGAWQRAWLAAVPLRPSTGGRPSPRRPARCSSCIGCEARPWQEARGFASPVSNQTGKASGRRTNFAEVTRPTSFANPAWPVAFRRKQSLLTTAAVGATSGRTPAGAPDRHVSVCVCADVYIIRTYMCVHVRMCVRVCACVCMCVCVYVCICMYAHGCVCVYIYIYIYAYVRMRVYVCACERGCGCQRCCNCLGEPRGA